MLESIVDLTRVRPHMRTSARFNTDERRAYDEGYYTGVCYALKVAEAAIGRFRLSQSERRRMARARRSA